MYRVKQENGYHKELNQSEKLLHFKKNEIVISGENNTAVDFLADIQLDAKVFMVKEQERLKQIQEAGPTGNVFGERTLGGAGKNFRQRNSIITLPKGNKMKAVMENHAKFFKIENFLSKKKKQNKDSDHLELQETREGVMKERVKHETNTERYRKNKVMMQATMEACEKRISDGGRQLKNTYKSSKGIKTVKYDPLANLHPWAEHYTGLGESCIGLKKEYLRNKRMAALLEMIKIPDSGWKPSSSKNDDGVFCTKIGFDES